MSYVYELHIMSKSRNDTQKAHQHLLNALKSNNIKALVEVIQKCDKRTLNRRLKYEVNDHQRLFSPLLAAIDLSSTELVKFLLSKGVDVNKKGFSSNLKEEIQHIYTPLFLACCAGRIDVIPLLVEAGADVNSGAGDKKVREEEGGYLHMEGVYPLLNFSLMYLTSSVTTALLLAGADPSLSLMSIMQYNYHVNQKSIKTLLQAGALLDVDGLEAVQFLLEYDIINNWEVMEIVSCDFSLDVLEQSFSSFQAVFEQVFDEHPSGERDRDEVNERRQVIRRMRPETLMNCCRQQIRRMAGNIKLFHIIDNLKLPSQLENFLLFGYSLHCS